MGKNPNNRDGLADGPKNRSPRVSRSDVERFAQKHGFAAGRSYYIVTIAADCSAIEVVGALQRASVVEFGAGGCYSGLISQALIRFADEITGQCRTLYYESD
jgi:hypothetical protein